MEKFHRFFGGFEFPLPTVKKKYDILIIGDVHIPIGIFEDVPIVVANVAILTDFVILDIPEDDSMSIILGRPFLNTAGAVIDCNKGNVTFHVNGYEYMVHFLKKQPQVYSINSIGKISTITIGGFEFPLPTIKKKYDILIVGDMHIPVEVT